MSGRHTATRNTVCPAYYFKKVLAVWGLQTYDLVMLAVLILATGFGAWKGMAWQVASSASLVLSYFVALKFSERLAPLFGEAAPTNRFIAMFVLYAGTSLAIWIAFRGVRNFVDRVKLREF